MATLGVEMEFKTSQDGLIAYNEAIIKGAFRDMPYQMSCDHAQLMEIKTPIIKAEKRDFDRDVIEMRDRFTERICSLGIPFTYYGMHVSVWNFAEPNMVPIAELCGPPPWAIILGFLSTHPRNVYNDPFIDTCTPVYHSIFICDRQEALRLQKDVFQEKVDATSWETRKRVFHLLPDLKDLLNYGPVPGGSLRVQKANRLELILGWLPVHVEKRLFETFAYACLKDGPKADPDENSITLISKRGGQPPRIATSYLSGYTYKGLGNPPHLPERITGNYLKMFKSL